MATRIQSNGAHNDSGSATSLGATFAAPTGAGRTLTARFNLYNGTTQVNSVTDDQSNTWVNVLRRRSTTDSNFSIEEWKCEGATAGVTTITGSLSGGAYVGMAIHEIDGGAVTATSAQVATTGGTLATGAALEAPADGLHLASVSYEDAARSFTPSTGWTQSWEEDEGNSAGAVIVAERAALNGVSQTPSWDTSGNFQVLISHLVIADAGGGPPPSGNRRRRLLMQ